MGVRVAVGPTLGHAEHFLGVVLPYLVVGDHRHADAHEHGLLVPRLTHAVAIDGAGLQSGRHLRRRRHRQQHVGAELARHVALVRRVVARVQAAGGQPVAQLVVVRGHRKHHPHVERLALGAVIVDHRLERTGRNGVRRLAVGAQLQVRLHLFPDGIRDGNGVAVQVHAERGDDLCLGTETDGGTQRLAGQHVRSVQFAGNHPIQQHLPVGLRLQGDEQTLVLEIALLVGNRQRRHVGELDKAELQHRLFGVTGGGDWQHHQCTRQHDQRACQALPPPAGGLRRLPGALPEWRVNGVNETCGIAIFHGFLECPRAQKKSPSPHVAE